MIRHKKIRGHKRIWKSIDRWIERTKHLDLEYLKRNQRDYVKVWVYPYSGISVLKSEFSPPKGTTRKKIITGLLDLYHLWKQQLETLKEPYYLRIWFYNDDISKSQVVCAIGDCLDFYENTFFDPKENKPFPIDNLGLQWEHRHFETHVCELDIGEPKDFFSEKDFLENKKWVKDIINNPKARKSEHEEFNGKTTTYYSIKTSDVWLGYSN